MTGHHPNQPVSEPRPSRSAAGSSFPPVMRQDWRELLFLHWPVDAAAVAARVPAPLEIDTWDGRAWIGLVPFEVRRLRPPLLPPVPFVSSFAEVNVRTYVRLEGQPSGVWFFSLDAASRLAAAAARLTYRLPYHFARGELRRRDGAIRFDSRRPGGRGRCSAVWRRSERIDGAAAPGSLEEFLVERYVLYTASAGRLLRARVRHRPYPLAAAELESLDQDLVERAGFEVAGPPRVDASPGVDPRISAPEPVPD